MLDPSKYTPDRSLAAKIKRRLTYWRAAQAMTQTPKQGMISFTFDDFPKSAAMYGADILEQGGVKGTYYACTGMRGHSNVMGNMYETKDLLDLHSRGHEIGAHTHSHLDCARVNGATVRGEIEQNQTTLKNLGANSDARHFAWPYGETTYKNKSNLGDLIQTARGILPGINRKGSDLMQLGAFELTPDNWTTTRAAKAIEETARNGGWTIIFTHDVRQSPSPFGTSPQALKGLLKRAKEAELKICPVEEAYSHLKVEGCLV